MKWIFDAAKVLNSIQMVVIMTTKIAI